MGSCNCTENKADNDPLRLESTNIKLNFNQSFSELDDLKSSPKEIKTFIQGLVRGYLVRRSFISPSLSPALSALYSSLPEFNLGLVPEKSCKLPSGLYIGEVNQFKEPHGKGRLFQYDCVSEGTWNSGRLNGFCRVVNSYGEIFTGDFINNVKEGYGELIAESEYKGEWKNNQKHGKGEEEFQNGSKYQGQYYKDSRHGTGLFMWQDGSSYEGDFRNNTIEGFGTYMWTGGRSYKGQWKNNKMHGRGKFTWEDGRVYEGEYFNNEKSGFGILCTKNGKKYEGKWENGKQHGAGVLYSGSTVKKGTWNDGKFCG